MTPIACPPAPRLPHRRPNRTREVAPMSHDNEVSDDLAYCGSLAPLSSRDIICDNDALAPLSPLDITDREALAPLSLLDIGDADAEVYSLAPLDLGDADAESLAPLLMPEPNRNSISAPPSLERAKFRVRSLSANSTVRRRASHRATGVSELTSGFETHTGHLGDRTDTGHRGKHRASQDTPGTLTTTNSAQDGRDCSPSPHDTRACKSVSRVINSMSSPRSSGYMSGAFRSLPRTPDSIPSDSELDSGDLRIDVSFCEEATHSKRRSRSTTTRRASTDFVYETDSDCSLSSPSAARHREAFEAPPAAPMPKSGASKSNGDDIQSNLEERFGKREKSEGNSQHVQSNRSGSRSIRSNRSDSRDIESNLEYNQHVRSNREQYSDVRSNGGERMCDSTASNQRSTCSEVTTPISPLAVAAAAAAFHLGDMCVDVLGSILGFLKIKEMFMCRRVAKHWPRAVSVALQQARVVTADASDSMLVKKVILCSVPRVCRNARSLNSHLMAVVSPRELLRLIRNCPTLESLGYEHHTMTDEFFPLVHAHLPSLTHLNVNAHSERDLDRLMDFTALRKLSLWNHVKELDSHEEGGDAASGTTVSSATRHRTLVERLGYKLIKIITRHPSLEELILHDFDMSEGVLRALRQLPRLRKLWITFSNVSDSFCELIVEHAPQVRV